MCEKLQSSNEHLSSPTHEYAIFEFQFLSWLHGKLYRISPASKHPLLTVEFTFTCSHNNIVQSIFHKKFLTVLLTHSALEALSPLNYNQPNWSPHTVQIIGFLYLSSLLVEIRNIWNHQSTHTWHIDSIFQLVPPSTNTIERKEQLHFSLQHALQIRGCKISYLLRYNAARSNTTDAHFADQQYLQNLWD